VYDRDDFSEEEDLPAKPQRWFGMPIALVAYVMLAVWLVVFIWQLALGGWPSDFMNGVAGVALVYLLAAFILHKLDWPFEGAVATQVALVLTPLIIMVNMREPEHDPVFVFVMPRGYSGPLEINFVDINEMKVRNSADTLYFAFNEEGRIALWEDYKLVRKAMRNNLRVAYANNKTEPVLYLEKQENFPADTNRVVVKEDSTIAAKGKMVKMTYFVGRVADFKRK
jgi:hypothetical protein